MIKIFSVMKKLKEKFTFAEELTDESQREKNSLTKF